MNAAVRLLAWLLAITLVALPVVGLLNGWFAADRWPIRRLSLTAEYERVSAEQVRAVVAPQGGRGFFAVDLESIRRGVAALPWVADVEVRKRWPDAIEIRIREHRPVARWGDDRLLSDRGTLFAAPGSRTLQGVPELSGPDSRIDDVVAFYRNSRAALSGTGLTLRGVRLAARGSWTLTLDDGARIVLGRTEPLERLARFARAWPRIAGDRRGFARADLRYTHGFAIAWPEPASPEVPAAPGAAPTVPPETQPSNA